MRVVGAASQFRTADPPSASDNGMQQRTGEAIQSSALEERVPTEAEEVALLG